MARVKLVALRPTFQHRVGTHFEASEAYAKVLVRLGVARVDLNLEEPDTSTPARKKRTYKRRDMSAEGTDE